MKREDINFTRVTFSAAEVKKILAKEAGLSDPYIRFEDSNGIPSTIKEVILSTK